MSRISVVICCLSPKQAAWQLAGIPASTSISQILVLSQTWSAGDLRQILSSDGELRRPAFAYEIRVIDIDSYFSCLALARALEAAAGDDLLLVLPGYQVRFGLRAIERLRAVAQETGAGVVYSDFKEERDAGTIEHPTIDYQLGSIRDNFDFGPALLISREAVEQALRCCGETDARLRWGALYDLRLKIAVDRPVLRIPEFLYSCRTWQGRSAATEEASYEVQFGYVDPRNREYQVEMEWVATEHLRRIGAYLEPDFLPLPDEAEVMRVSELASVVIPVRNREKTIADAVRSALGQATAFPFNVLAIDNHSRDRTSEILEALSREDPRLIHRIPDRTDLGIGGCWNEAIYSDACGRYAVQLDSDDLYADEHTLARMVSKFGEGEYAMVIGSYKLVDFHLKEIPPGVIDHREWTRENGRNNALRISGLGAPRAFHVPTLRRFGFPNVSYGEDYAVALRIGREYEIGRIYDSIYLCRRWQENTDAALPLVTMNRYDQYKDRLRTIEIMARRRSNAAQGG